MNNVSSSFPLQEVMESTSQLVLTYSNFSVEAKLSIFAIVVTLLLEVIKAYKEHQTQQEKLEGLFNITWKNSRSIKKDEISGNRLFDEYYYIRDEDEKARDCLEKEKRVLIVGPPLSGKTRMVYEALRKSKKYDLIIPKAKDINTESFFLPRRLRVWQPKIMFIDDLHRFVELQNFECLFDKCRKNKINLIVTCRSGIEYEKTKKIMSYKNINLGTKIFDEIIELKDISEETGKEIAKNVKKDWNKIRFTKTIGSIFMILDDMDRRFKACTPEEKAILRAIKKLYICGVYDEGQIFQLDQIKIVSKNEDLKKKKYEWEELIRNLCEKEFIKIEKKEIDRIWAEEVYLEDIVELNSSELSIFEELLSTFEQFPDVLVKMGKHAYEIGSVILQKANYMKMSIKIYQNALKIRTDEQFPMDYATIQTSIGTAYRALAEVEDKAQNCKKAIKAHKNALKITTEEQFPIQYAGAQHNIGAAYGTLAEVEDKAQNCKKAIEAYQNALKIRTVEQFPMDYAMTQNNIGAAYDILAEVEDQAPNCKKSIEAFQNALKIYTEEQFPIYYAMIMHNIGATYRTLAEVEDKTQNCKKAIEAYQNALKITTREQFPMDYAMTQNNIGNAYETLAEVEETAQNCKKAIEAYQNALKIRTEEQFPIQYALTQNNIGEAYGTLAEVEDKAQNCKKAMEAYQNALKIYTEEQYPIQYTMTQNNLDHLIDFCKINDIEIIDT